MEALNKELLRDFLFFGVFFVGLIGLALTLIALVAAMIAFVI